MQITTELSQVAISTEMGATNNWERNIKKAKAEGLTPCTHCGKGILDGQGYEVRIITENELVIPFNREEGKVVLVGTTCVKNFAHAKLTNDYFRKVGA